MRHAERNHKYFKDVVKKDLPLAKLDWRAEDISAAPTNYSDITLHSLEDIAVSTFSFICNIEARLLDEIAAAELSHPTIAGETPSFPSLNGVEALEQYEHLSQLLHR